MKYLYTKVVFSEVPEEITLALSISDCKIHCPECNQKELWKDIGKPLNWGSLNALIHINHGITCVAFMGGKLEEVRKLALKVKDIGLKTCWYTGEDELPKDLRGFDYIKIGHYDDKLGGLDKETTNQRMYHIEPENIRDYNIIDITFKFKKSYEIKN